MLKYILLFQMREQSLQGSEANHRSLNEQIQQQQSLINMFQLVKKSYKLEKLYK